MALEERDNYENLILLCKIHHKLVDDNPNDYTVERLGRMKSNHEKWVRKCLAGFDAARQRDREKYADYVEEWSRLAEIDNWPGWASNLVQNGIPAIKKCDDDRLAQLETWSFSRIWPGRYPELKASFESFRLVLNDLRNLFHEHATHRGPDDQWLRTDRFYKIGHWDAGLYDRLSRQYGFHVDLIEDLALELTRAANYVCDRVRQFIDPTFRSREGALWIEGGPYSDFVYRKYRPEYHNGERVALPYRGLAEFLLDRESRDVHFGQGVWVADP